MVQTNYFRDIRRYHQVFLLVQVPSPFVYEYLEENYVNLLSKVLTRVFGKGIHLKYRIVTDKTHNLTQDIQSDTVDNGWNTATNQIAQIKVQRH